MISERLSHLEQALWEARPHAVADVAITAAGEAFGASAVEILLADYQASHLVPVTPGRDAVRIDHSAAGRAFAEQAEILEKVTGGLVEARREVRAHVPLTVYGERMGVLSVTLPRPPDEGLSEDLAAAALALARALAVADSRTDAYRRIRRRIRLTLAAEIQWELLPGRSCVTEEFDLAGQLEPAYAVWGDNFDWSVSSEHLTVTVTNGMGQGIDAALLTQLTIGALRNARRSDADLAEQAALANQAIHAQHGGARHVGTLLLRFELASGRVEAIEAGSPLLYRMRDDAVRPVTLDGQLPLGMFNDTEYAVEEFALLPGDRLVIVSDGVHESRSPLGELYGAVMLAKALRETREQSPAEVVRTLMHGLLTYVPEAQLADDAVIVCLDWTGAPAGRVVRLTGPSGPPRVDS